MSHHRVDLLAVLRARVPAALDSRLEIDIPCAPDASVWRSSPHGAYDLCLGFAHGALRCEVVRVDDRRVVMCARVTWHTRDGRLVRRETRVRMVMGVWSWRVRVVRHARGRITLCEESEKPGRTLR